MTAEATTEAISIRPGVSVLSVLRHLNYKPWYAVAEFVDNAIQSYQDCEEALAQTTADPYVLKVSIEIDANDDGRIVIRDNAAGIHTADYARAFRAAAVPPNHTGLSEFGMGMKSAACWFARRWEVRSTALDESIERTVQFDIDAIVKDSIEELEVTIRPVRAADHYTEIVLWDLHHKPQKRTVSKIKEHLTSIYRVFLRDGHLELTYNGDALHYSEPEALRTPWFKDPGGPAVEWEKRIEIDLGDDRRVDGWAALLGKGSTSEAGFALFRRNRLIQGSADDGYRPAEIFKASNSFTYQRLFGELHLEGLGVSHTKDGIQWGGLEERFLDQLKQQLDAEPLRLLDQAEGFRAKRKPEEYRSGAEIAVRKTADVIQREVPIVIEQQLAAPLESAAPPISLPISAAAAERVIRAKIQGRAWEIVLELSEDPAISDWVSFFDNQPSTVAADPATPRRIGVRVSMAHPFMERFSGTTSWEIEPLLRLAAAIALAEITARDAGIKFAGTIRRNINDLLREALAQP